MTPHIHSLPIYSLLASSTRVKHGTAQCLSYLVAGNTESLEKKHFHDIVCNQRFWLAKSTFHPGDNLNVGECPDPSSFPAKGLVLRLSTNHWSILMIGMNSPHTLSLQTFTWTWFGGNLMLAELKIRYETNFEAAAERREEIKSMRSCHWSLQCRVWELITLEVGSKGVMNPAGFQILKAAVNSTIREMSEQMLNRFQFFSSQEWLRKHCC